MSLHFWGQLERWTIEQGRAPEDGAESKTHLIVATGRVLRKEKEVPGVRFMRLVERVQQDQKMRERLTETRMSCDDDELSRAQ